MLSSDLKKILEAHAKWVSSNGTSGARADLRSADLRSANLRSANLDDPMKYVAAFWIVPEVGSFVGWKRLQNNLIAKVEIPEDARRTSSLQGRKCRAEFVKVLELQALDGTKNTGSGKSIHDSSVSYKAGEIVRPDSYDDSVRVECSNGIHFFVCRQEAVDYA